MHDAYYRADMTTADRANQASSIPTSRKLLCVVYGAIAVTALIATWSQTLAYSDKGAGSLLAYWNDARILPASRALTSDLLLFGLAAVIFMVVEARKHGIKFVWLYVVASYTVCDQCRFSRLSDRPRNKHQQVRRAWPSRNRHDPPGGCRHFYRAVNCLDRRRMGLRAVFLLKR
jgi:Terpene cyclase DEP1